MKLLDIPADQAEKAAELHGALVEKAAESDEALMELFFTNDTLSEDEIRKGIAKGIQQEDCFLYYASHQRIISVLTGLWSLLQTRLRHFPICRQSEQ